MNINQTVRAAVMGLVVAGSTSACHQTLSVYHHHRKPIIDRHLEVVAQGTVTLGEVKNDAGVILADDALTATSAQYTKLGSCVSVLKAANRIIISKSGRESTLELLDGSGNSLALLAADLGSKKFMVASSAGAFPVSTIEAFTDEQNGAMVLEKLVFTCEDNVLVTVDQAQNQAKEPKQMEQREALSIDLLVTLDAVKEEVKQEVQAPVAQQKQEQQKQEEQKPAPVAPIQQKK